MRLEAMTDFTCSICEGNRAVKVLSYRGHDLFRCLNCTHVQVWPLPGPEELIAHYSSTTDELDNNFAFRNLADYRTSPRSAYKFKRRAFKDMTNISRLREQRERVKILELGAGSGTDLAVLRDFYAYKNENLVGVEINPGPVEQGREQLGLDLRVGEMSREIAVDAAPFDAVYALHVIEHVISPRRTLETIREVLKPQGILFLNLPNYRSAQRILLGKDWQWLMPPGHLHYFTPASMRVLLEKTGYLPMKIYSEQNFFPGGYLADMLRIFKKILRWPKQETKDYIPPFSYYDRRYALLWAADLAARVITFPFWLYTRLSNRGACLIVTAQGGSFRENHPPAPPTKAFYKKDE